MSGFLMFSGGIALLALASYVGVLAISAFGAYEAKKELSKPKPERHPPFLSGEDLLG
jgi:hypothetical protein